MKSLSRRFQYVEEKVKASGKSFEDHTLEELDQYWDEAKLKGLIEMGDIIMRLDKFLKVSRLIKRRTLAKEVSDQGRIEINGKEAKASSTVKVGDELTIRLGQRKVTARIDRIQETSRKDEAAEMYTIIKEEKIGASELTDL